MWACLVDSKSSLWLRSAGCWCDGDASTELVVGTGTTSLWNRRQAAFQVCPAPATSFSQVSQLPEVCSLYFSVVKMRLLSIRTRETEVKRKRNSFCCYFCFRRRRMWNKGWSKLKAKLCAGRRSSLNLSATSLWASSCVLCLLFKMRLTAHFTCILYSFPRKYVMYGSWIRVRIRKVFSTTSL